MSLFVASRTIFFLSFARFRFRWVCFCSHSFSVLHFSLAHRISFGIHSLLYFKVLLFNVKKYFRWYFSFIERKEKRKKRKKEFARGMWRQTRFLHSFVLYEIYLNLLPFEGIERKKNSTQKAILNAHSAESCFTTDIPRRKFQQFQRHFRIKKTRKPHTQIKKIIKKKQQ